MASRLSKILLLASAGLYLSLITLNNLIDYDSNLQFVQHVLSMDDTFPNNRLMWRAITHPMLHHLVYGVIIVWEGIAALLCWMGLFFLRRNFRSDGISFNRAKSIATAGLVLSLLLWLFGFLVVGGEWFLMWQSSKWNGQNAAARLFLVFGIVLLFLNQPDEDLER
ncbi:MAG TPA: DUF2165 domain-containing protein [Candidatus Manganitrophaceae bacterium]|nr:DUF2165 domain-containing protein [Candidatus Manganitrophaceae bacterium]